ncbi:MAG: hypothetical protein IT530_05005 [Burkholderiales bacterium]|nr:hypothetical protein [Burkholderiales bacterium]
MLIEHLAQLWRGRRGQSSTGGDGEFVSRATPSAARSPAAERMGVARITIAAAPTLVVMSTIQKLAADLRATGGFDMLTATIRHPDAQELFRRKE